MRHLWVVIESNDKGAVIRNIADRMHLSSQDVLVEESRLASAKYANHVIQINQSEELTQ